MHCSTIYYYSLYEKKIQNIEKTLTISYQKYITCTRFIKKSIYSVYYTTATLTPKIHFSNDNAFKIKAELIK